MPAQWSLAKTSAKTLYIEPGSPWENGYCRSFNSKLRDEFLNGEIFPSMKGLRGLTRTLARPLQPPSGHTPRWATDHPLRRHGCEKPLGQENCQWLRAWQLSRPYPATIPAQ